MRVILEVLSGPESGRKTLLGAGQSLRVGRTQRADFCVPDDNRISGVHFSLETDDLACYAQDLGSSNGTTLNGQPLTERTVVRNGDKLHAGQTAFVVRTEGDSPDEAEAAAAARKNQGPQPAPRGLAGNPAGASYSVERCDSGLTLCRGSAEAVEPGALAAAVAGTCPAWWIVDFHKLDRGTPEGLGSDSYLFDWFEPAVAALVSPVLLAPDEAPDLSGLIQEGWGCDALVCLFSKMDKPALLAHLRERLRAKPGQKTPSDGIVGFCWPGVMAPLLAHYPPKSAEKLLEGIEAVLVELPDLPLMWQFYGREEITKLLDQAGLVEEPSESETPTAQ